MPGVHEEGETAAVFNSVITAVLILYVNNDYCSNYRQKCKVI